MRDCGGTSAGSGYGPAAATKQGVPSSGRKNDFIKTSSDKQLNSKSEVMPYL